MPDFARRLLLHLSVALATTAVARAEVLIGLAAPLTGPYAWGVPGLEANVEAAVADLNDRGGVLGEPIEIIVADDYCDGAQAIAAANKLIADGVAVVFGHQCSGAAIPATEVYARAGIPMISTGATNPTLTERGLSNVFRVIGRDDVQGEMAAELLAERWRDVPVAILHDGQAYGKGHAEEVKKQLNERGITEALFEAVEPGKPEYLDAVQSLQSMGVEVLYYGGYMAEAGLIVRHAADLGYDRQLVGGDGVSPKDFGLIAGPAPDGTLMTYLPRPPETPAAVELQRRSSADFSLSSSPTPRSRPGRRRSRRRDRLRLRRSLRRCGRTSSTPCSGTSASTRRATSPATSRSPGTSGRTGTMPRSTPAGLTD
jgi:branched-chain amino acid transport system substrate-binding protein